MNNNYIENFNKIFEEKCNVKYLPSILPAVDKIIVIGDIHGDFTKLKKILKKTKIIDNNNNWVGKDTVIVQVGDQIDSCRNAPYCHLMGMVKDDKAEDITILEFMTELHEKAQEHGGAVYSLLGNHEIMNVNGDFSYVSYENIKEFGDSEKRREAFKPGNKIASFLACTRKTALIIGSNLFVHAGIIPKLLDRYNIEDINKILSLFLLDELHAPDVFKDIFINGKHSPLWTRVFGENMNKEQCKLYLQPLKSYNVGKIFVGHTPQIEDGINSICNEQIWRTDVGTSKAFDEFKTKETIQVLEIKYDSKIKIINI